MSHTTPPRAHRAEAVGLAGPRTRRAESSHPARRVKTVLGPDSKTMRYELVDVFTDRPLTGNALAVVHAHRELEAAAMQAIAREFNLSETVFLHPPSSGDADVRLRIFTPAEELPFAGHPTLGGAAVVAWGRLEDKPGDVWLRLEEQVGLVPVMVVVEDDRRAFARLTAPAPRLREVTADPVLVAGALGLSHAELVEDSPPRIASSGVPFLFVHVHSLDVVRRVRPHAEQWDRLREATPAHGVVVFCMDAEEPGASVHGRMFSPQLGIAEDPATGAAAAPLGALLVERRLVAETGGRASFVLEQGYEMGRPSRLHVDLDVRDGALGEVTVGGGVVRVARGELLA